jgi:F-type H+-transporting ATPase subunit delta
MLDKLRSAKRYAKIFLNKKMDKNEMLVLAAEMQFLANTLISDSYLMEFFECTVIPREKKLTAIRKISENCGFSKYTLRLLEILVEHKRENLITLVSSELHLIADQLLSRIRVKMTTASEPSVDEIDDLNKRIGGFFKKNIFIERYIDPSIIGGFILEGDGKLIDLSIYGQLKRIYEKKL